MTPEGTNLGSEADDPKEIRRIRDDEAIEHLDSAYELLDSVVTLLKVEYPGLTSDLEEAQQHIDEANNYLVARLGLLPVAPADEELLDRTMSEASKDQPDRPVTGQPEANPRGPVSAEDLALNANNYATDAWVWLQNTWERADLDAIRKAVTEMKAFEEAGVDSTKLRRIIAQFERAIEVLENPSPGSIRYRPPSYIS